MAASSLGEIAEIVMGQSPPGEMCNSEGLGLPLLNGPTEYGPHHPSPVQFTTDARKRARPGDILFCVRGSTTGRMNWADRDYAIGRGVAAIRHKHRAELQPFVRAVIDYELRGLLAHATGSTFPNVSASQLAALAWPPIPEPEQRAIAHILGTLDDKIELNRRMNETLEAMARALFKSWFVDFLPVRAKMAAANQAPYVSTLPPAEKGKWFVYAMECDDGSVYIGQAEDLRQRWQQHSSGKGGRWTKGHPPVRVVYWEVLPSRQEAVEREKWLKTGYGRKWLKRQITAASARTQTGDPLPASAGQAGVRAKAEGRQPLPAPQSEAARQAGGLPKPLADLFPDRLVPSELGEIPAGWEAGTLADFTSLNPESWSKNTRPDEIRYVDLSNTKLGRIDLVAVYPKDETPSRAQRVLRPRDTIVGTVRPGNASYALVSEDGLTGSTGFAVLRPGDTAYAEFVYLAATAADNIEALSHLADGGAYPAVRPEVVAATQVVRPNGAVLARFSQYASGLLDRIAENERETRTLAALRDALLPKLISGELRVKHAERIMNRAV